uniref:NADH dehydrogenase subunit 2 n=1 Tax=Haematococcus lacustris TaxID=44745 RepID=A0A5B9R4G2_HAELA|nr:NADH dehydrogenase subunit 2 [Haematococcus lacustris]QEG54844.1 NADH dehydrogenase subunit 2 [Haematococcus lacustris]
MLMHNIIILDNLASLILLIVYSLFCIRYSLNNKPLKTSTNNPTYSFNKISINLRDVFMFAQIYPILFITGYIVEGFIYTNASGSFIDMVCTITPNVLLTNALDIGIVIIMIIVLRNFQTIESTILLLLAFINSYYMLHSVSLMSFYITLEGMNFCFIVLCGLQTINKGSNSFSVESTLKYFLLSAFSTGVLLYWFSYIYLQTGISVIHSSIYGITTLSINSGLDGGYMDPSHIGGSTAISTFTNTNTMEYFLIISAIMFKLGAAPVHLWVVQIYTAVKRSLLMYISTVPKIALFGFWTNSLHQLFNTGCSTGNTDSLNVEQFNVVSLYSVAIFVLFSIFIGSISAYNLPSLRALFAYSTINEIGILLMAIETAGFHSLYTHLSIYIISMLLLWNTYDKRFFTILAISLAGLPPLAGFFGKFVLFWYAGLTGAYTLLYASLLTTGISLVYYLRLIRLFWNKNHKNILPYNSFSSYIKVHASIANRAYTNLGYTNNIIQYVNINKTPYFTIPTQRFYLNSLCMVLIVYLPLFVIKPFIL